MSLLNNITIGASGLRAASAGLSVTSHNVVNATTEGYQRRRVDQTTLAPSRVPAGVTGRGVSVQGFLRQGSELLTKQQVAGEGDFSRAATRQQALSSVESLVDETQLTGPHQATVEFFDALQLATQDPADAGLRRAVVTKAKNVGKTMGATANGLDRALAAQDASMAGGVERFNELARELAVVNRDIVSMDSPGDLMDQRDRLLREAGTLVGATANFEKDGTATMLLQGHAVVSGPSARTVSLTADNRIAVDVGAGAVNVDAGGKLGGLIDAREVTQGIRDTLSNSAKALADAMNAAHTGGFDRSGTLGGDLFTYDATDPGATLRVTSAIDADPELLAFAANASALAGDGGNLTLMSDVENQALVAGQTVGKTLSGITTSIASTLSSSLAEAEHGALVLGDLDALQASLAGVDLDEEAANLMLFQTAYQASAKVIRINDELLGTLMEMV